ncbi:SDR family oxidoreductase [Falsigemmobacter faecalis]|nr:SDR family oxidoreductase [Falsigemmobacter faecalis]
MTTPPRRAALITGSARRLGAAMARALSKEGWFVVLHCHHSRGEGEALVAELRAAGADCGLVCGPLTTKAGAEAVFAAAVALAGPLSLLVNNASAFLGDDLATAEEAGLAQHMAVNLAAPLWLMQRFQAQDPLPEGALVVNMLDNKLMALNPDFFTYTLSKAALKAATEMAAQSFGGHPRVCAIAPSITLMSGAQTAEDFERTARINPLGRRVAPADICEALLLLWADRGLNGEILVIDGGQHHWNLPRDVAFLTEEDIPLG